MWAYDYCVVEIRAWKMPVAKSEPISLECLNCMQPIVWHMNCVMTLMGSCHAGIDFRKFYIVNRDNFLDNPFCSLIITDTKLDNPKCYNKNDVHYIEE